MEKINFTQSEMYKINNLLSKDYKVADNNSKIFICVFSIIDSINNININIPFLKYFLYKYPESNKETSNYITFPFDYSNKNEKINTTANSLFKKIFDLNVNTDGYIYYNDNYYFFYNYDSYKHETKYIQKNEIYWWSTIDEICNHKKVIHFPIHYSTFSIFYNYPDLIYLTNNNNKKYEIPTIAYFGNTI